MKNTNKNTKSLRRREESEINYFIIHPNHKENKQHTYFLHSELTLGVHCICGSPSGFNPIT